VVLAAHDLLHVFETAGRRLERTIDSRQDSIEAVSFSPDGRWLASAAHDGSARVFDVESGTLLAALNHAAGQPLRAIAFAPDGQSLVTAGDDGVARLYRLRSFAGFDELLAFASKLQLEPLTTEERSALFIAER
jgi:WD40 repeat protein